MWRMPDKYPSAGKNQRNAGIILTLHKKDSDQYGDAAVKNSSRNLDRQSRCFEEGFDFLAGGSVVEEPDRLRVIYIRKIA